MKISLICIGLLLIGWKCFMHAYNLELIHPYSMGYSLFTLFVIICIAIVCAFFLLHLLVISDKGNVYRSFIKKRDRLLTDLQDATEVNAELELIKIRRKIRKHNKQLDKHKEECDDSWLKCYVDKRFKSLSAF